MILQWLLTCWWMQKSITLFGFPAVVDFQIHSNAREVEMALHAGDMNKMLLALQGGIYIVIKKLRKSQVPEQTLNQSCGSIGLLRRAANGLTKLVSVELLFRDPSYTILPLSHYNTRI
jgi:hypothetical protein